MIGLLRVRARVAWTSAKRGEGMFNVLAVVAALLGLAILGGTFALMRLAVREHAPAAEALLLMAFAVVGMVQLLGAVRKSVTRMFLNSDLELYLAAPLSHDRLWVLKIVEVAAASEASAFFLFAVAAGYALAVSPITLPLAAAAVVATALTSAAAGTTVTLLLARILPPRLLEAGLGVLAALTGASLAMLGPADGGGFGGSATPDGPRAALEALAGVRTGLRWFPMAWPGTALSAMTEGHMFTAVAASALVVLGIAVIGAVGYVVFRTTFYVTWGRIAEASERRRRSTTLDRLTAGIPAPARAIITKDWRIILRDPRQLMALFMPVVMMSFILVRGTLEDVSGGRFLAIFMVSLAVIGLAHDVFSLEGRNLMLFRSAPVDMRVVFWGKFGSCAIPTIAGGGLAMTLLGAAQGWTPSETVGMVVASGWIASVVLLANLALAALWTNFDGEPSERPNPGGPLAGMALALVVIGAHSLFPAWLAARAQVDALGHPMIGMLALTPAVLAVTGALWLARRAVARLDRVEVA